uniref:Fibrinogen C-terminal domain-containing protein n=1 Tax=Amphimedon queenslandica TaxID=400682 RepID=A0A1X7TNN4_AMPQE
MESHVEENQYSTADEVMYEMKALPSSQEPELQCQVQPQHSKKYTEDKWLLCIIAIVLVVILVLLIILVFMCGFLISQPSPAECSTTATGAAVAGLTATDNQMCQLCNETLIHFAQEIRKSIGNIVNGTTNSTQSLVQGSIEQLALLVDIAQEINRNVNNAHYGTNEILSHITNVTHINNVLALDHTENLIKLSNSFHSIDAGIENSTQILSLIEIALNNNTNLFKTYAACNSDSLPSIVNTLSNIQDTSTSTAGVVDDILIVVQELLQLHNASSSLPTSCKQIRHEKPNSPSGIYILVTTNGSSLYYTYCNMEELCGSGGGWTRLGYLDMSDSTVNCPSGFRLYQSGGVRACGRPVTSSGSCVSVQFPSNGISYSQVCGRVTGYQYYTPDAVNDEFGSNHNNLNGDYVDGVSITRGSPRQHVWTLMAGNFEDNVNFLPYNCPCATGSTQQVQSFIGDHYFCESGIVGQTRQQQLYTSDPLWDGQSCGSAESPCCNVTGIPWFHRDYGNTTTTDYIELRVCGDEDTSNEDVPVSYYEIYVQ